MVREGSSTLNEYQPIGDALSAAADRLAGISESPRLDAELLLARAIDVTRAYLMAHPEDQLDPDAQVRYAAAIERRASGVPLAYITGLREFWSLELMVTPATLVPRPETERLVEQALSLLPRRAALRILDLGTGSGAIALALARERPLCQVVATDASEAALAVARENARQLDIDNVEFVAGDWTAPVGGREFDLVVSNPPYVAAGDPALDRLKHEPRAALASGPDGLDAIRRIAAEVGDILAPGGSLLVEHGAEQEAAVAAILDAAGWHNVRCYRDLAGLPRVTAATRDRASAQPFDDAHADEAPDRVAE